MVIPDYISFLLAAAPLGWCVLGWGRIFSYAWAAVRVYRLRRSMIRANREMENIAASTQAYLSQLEEEEDE